MLLLSHSLVALTAYTLSVLLPRHVQLWLVSAILAAVLASLAPLVLRTVRLDVPTYLTQSAEYKCFDLRLTVSSVLRSSSLTLGEQVRRGVRPGSCRPEHPKAMHDVVEHGSMEGG